VTGLREWSHVIKGEPASKANSRILTKHMTFIKSSKARQYGKDFVAQLRQPAKLLGGPLSVRLTICYRTWQSDMDESLILDLLQGRVYHNDRQIVERHVYREPNRSKDPFVTITVKQITYDGPLPKGWPK
jgi:Holliday junction resolvase RusA-like endonuclease